MNPFARTIFVHLLGDANGMRVATRNESGTLLWRSSRVCHAPNRIIYLTVVDQPPSGDSDASQHRGMPYQIRRGQVFAQTRHSSTNAVA